MNFLRMEKTPSKNSITTRLGSRGDKVVALSNSVVLSLRTQLDCCIDNSLLTVPGVFEVVSLSNDVYA